MKTTKKSLGILLIALLLMGSMYSQDKEKKESSYQAYWIHEDQVKPSMVAEYERTAKDLVTNMTKHNIQGSGWLTSMTQDFRYFYVTPIESLKDINYEEFGVLQEKMGKEAMGKLFSDMDKCYNKHGDYVINLDKTLSYMPEGISQTTEGENYRQFIYHYATVENFPKLLETSKKIKALFEAKNSKVHYRIYKSGFGTMGNYMMVAISAKDAVDYATKTQANMELLGDEMKTLYGDIMKYSSKIKRVNGKIRPDLAYKPKKIIE